MNTRFIEGMQMVLDRCNGMTGFFFLPNLKYCCSCHDKASMCKVWWTNSQADSANPWAGGRKTCSPFTRYSLSSQLSSSSNGGLKIIRQPLKKKGNGSMMHILTGSVKTAGDEPTNALPCIFAFYALDLTQMDGHIWSHAEDITWTRPPQSQCLQIPFRPVLHKPNFYLHWITLPGLMAASSDLQHLENLHQWVPHYYPPCREQL